MNHGTAGRAPSLSCVAVGRTRRRAIAFDMTARAIAGACVRLRCCKAGARRADEKSRHDYGSSAGPELDGRDSLTGRTGSSRHEGREQNKCGREQRHLVETCRHLRDLSAQLSGFERRRARRPERHYDPIGLPEGAGHRRHLADAHLSFAAGRFRLRHLELRSYRSGIRHYGRLQSASRRSEEAEYPRHHGHGDEPHLG